MFKSDCRCWLLAKVTKQFSIWFLILKKKCLLFYVVLVRATKVDATRPLEAETIEGVKCHFCNILLVNGECHLNSTEGGMKDGKTQNQCMVMLKLGFPVAQVPWGRICLQCRRLRFLSLGWEDPLKKNMATYFIDPAWRIPWSEEPGELHFTGSQKS